MGAESDVNIWRGTSRITLYSPSSRVLPIAQHGLPSGYTCCSSTERGGAASGDEDAAFRISRSPIRRSVMRQPKLNRKMTATTYGGVGARTHTHTHTHTHTGPGFGWASTAAWSAPLAAAPPSTTPITHHGPNEDAPHVAPKGLFLGGGVLGIGSGGGAVQTPVAPCLTGAWATRQGEPRQQACKVQDPPTHSRAAPGPGCVFERACACVCVKALNATSVNVNRSLCGSPHTDCNTGTQRKGWGSPHKPPQSLWPREGRWSTARTPRPRCQSQRRRPPELGGSARNKGV
jgi:hypothetical protein